MGDLEFSIGVGHVADAGCGLLPLDSPSPLSFFAFSSLDASGETLLCGSLPQAEMTAESQYAVSVHQFHPRVCYGLCRETISIDIYPFYGGIVTRSVVKQRFEPYY